MKLLELDKFGQEQDARRMNIAKELMNIKSSNLVKNVISDSAPSNVRTPLYSAYEFDIEYLSPFLRTLNERIQKLNDAVCLYISIFHSNQFSHFSNRTIIYKEI